MPYPREQDVPTRQIEIQGIGVFEVPASYDDEQVRAHIQNLRKTRPEIFSKTQMFSPSGESKMVPNAELRSYVKRGYQTTPKTQLEQDYESGANERGLLETAQEYWKPRPSEVESMKRLVPSDLADAKRGLRGVGKTVMGYGVNFAAMPKELFGPPQEPTEVGIQDEFGRAGLSAYRLSGAGPLIDSTVKSVLEKKWGDAVRTGALAPFGPLGAMMYGRLEQANPGLSSLEQGAQPDPAGALINTGLDIATIKTFPQQKNLAMRVVRPVANAASRIPLPSMPTWQSARSVRSTVPSALALPPKAVIAAEDVFRAVAPVSKDSEFRQTLYKAVSDLSEIGRKIDERSWADAAGGTRQPDMRPQLVVNAINEHLTEMYNTERAPQINAFANEPLPIRFNPEAMEALQELADSGAYASERAAASAAVSGRVMNVATVDAFARAVNQIRLKWKNLGAKERAKAQIADRRYVAMQELDKALKNGLNDFLTDPSRGMPGIAAYEERFAALRTIEERLSRRKQPAELERTVPGGKLLSRLVHGKEALAGASMASVAEIRMGRKLEKGIRKLGELDLQPNRGSRIPPTVPPTAGALPPVGGAGGGIPVGGIPQPPSPSAVPAAPGQVAPGTRATRLGLELPARGGTTEIPTLAPPSASEGPTTVVAPAAETSGRGAGGRFKKVSTSGVGPQTPGTGGEVRLFKGENWGWDETTGEWFRMSDGARGRMVGPSKKAQGVRGEGQPRIVRRGQPRMTPEQQANLEKKVFAAGDAIIANEAARRPIPTQLLTMSREDFASNPPEGYRYDPNARAEVVGRREGNVTSLGKSFFESSPEARRILLNHEVGHDLLRNFDEFKDVLEPFRRPEYRDTPIGAHNVHRAYENPFGLRSEPSEIIADAYSYLFEGRGSWFFEDKSYPIRALLKKVVDAAVRKGRPVPPEVLAEYSDAVPQGRARGGVSPELAQNRAEVLQGAGLSPRDVRYKPPTTPKQPRYTNLPEIPSELHDYIEPDEAAFLASGKQSKLNQRRVVQAHEKIKASVPPEEVETSIQAGGIFRGWWDSFIKAHDVMYGEKHSEFLKAWNSATSGNKEVGMAHELGLDSYFDWLERGQPRDMKSINAIVKRARGISNSKGKIGLDTRKLFQLVNSPAGKGEAPFPNELIGHPLAGKSSGAMKIPSMAATVAQKGNLRRLVLDTHINDFFGKAKLTNNEYLAVSMYMREVAKKIGYAPGEGQESMWGTVLGLKELKGDLSGLNDKFILSLGKSYVEEMLNDQGIIGRIRKLEKYTGIKYESVLGELEKIASDLPKPEPGRQAVLDQAVLGRIASRFAKQAPAKTLKAPGSSLKTPKNTAVSAELKSRPSVSLLKKPNRGGR